MYVVNRRSRSRRRSGGCKDRELDVAVRTGDCVLGVRYGGVGKHDGEGGKGGSLGANGREGFGGNAAADQEGAEVVGYGGKLGSVRWAGIGHFCAVRRAL